VLSSKEAGGEHADAIEVGGKLATPLEPGHRYMGLRVVTDPNLITSIQAGAHPVHGWKRRGIAETVATDSVRAPGMYDTAVPSRNANRRTFPERRSFYPGDDCEIIIHPDYHRTWKPEAVGGLAPEDIGAAIAIIAAKSTLSLPHKVARDRMLFALQTIGSRPS
jgi:hypothetical protein